MNYMSEFFRNYLSDSNERVSTQGLHQFVPITLTYVQDGEIKSVDMNRVITNLKCDNSKHNIIDKFNQAFKALELPIKCEYKLIEQEGWKFGTLNMSGLNFFNVDSTFGFSYPNLSAHSDNLFEEFSNLLDTDMYGLLQYNLPLDVARSWYDIFLMLKNNIEKYNVYPKVEDSTEGSNETTDDEYRKYISKIPLFENIQIPPIGKPINGDPTKLKQTKYEIQEPIYREIIQGSASEVGYKWLPEVIKKHSTFNYDESTGNTSTNGINYTIKGCNGNTFCEKVMNGEVVDKEKLTSPQTDGDVVNAGSPYVQYNYYAQYYGYSGYTFEDISQANKSAHYLPVMWFSNLFNMDKKKTFPAIVFESTEDGFVFSFNSDNISKNGYNTQTSSNSSYYKNGDGGGHVLYH